MMSHVRLLGALLVCSLLGALRLLGEPEKPNVTAYGTIPVTFERNLGQAGANIEFLGHPNGGTVGLSAGKMIIEFQAAAGLPEERIGLALVGGNRHSRAEGLDPVSTRSNYFIGNDKTRWLTNIPHYG